MEKLHQKLRISLGLKAKRSLGNENRKRRERREGSFALAFPTPLAETFLPTGKERRRKQKTKYNEVEGEEEEEKKVKEEGRERREEKTKWGRGTIVRKTGENYPPHTPNILRCKI